MKEGSVTMVCTSQPLLRSIMGLGSFSKNHSGGSFFLKKPHSCIEILASSLGTRYKGG